MFHLISFFVLVSLVLINHILQEVMFFDLVFMFQHFILYLYLSYIVVGELLLSFKLNKDAAEPLIRSSEDPESGNMQVQVYTMVYQGKIYRFV